MCRVAFDYVGLKMEDQRPDRSSAFSSRRSRDPARDATKAREKLGWQPIISLEAMIRKMVRADLERLAPLRNRAAAAADPPRF